MMRLRGKRYSGFNLQLTRGARNMVSYHFKFSTKQKQQKNVVEINEATISKENKGNNSSAEGSSFIIQGFLYYMPKIGGFSIFQEENNATIGGFKFIAPGKK
jgi:hypothetical protein